MRPVLLPRLVLCLLGLFCFLRLSPAVAADTPLIPVGTGSFRYADTTPTYKEKPLTVHFYLPEGVSLQTAPILFVMHGTLRNGAEYRDLWIAQAKKYHFLLLVPEYSKKDYPNYAYNRGNIAGENDDMPQPESLWTFPLIERLFDYVKAATGSRSARYYLYGHSAGGQFVHRFVQFMPKARIARAVSANAGYYTLPGVDDSNHPYPFSLKGVPVAADAKRRKAVFGQEMIVLLGEEDTDPKDPDLYHSPEADQQGMFRFARGKNFYAAAQKEAVKLGVPLRWTLQTVPGVGHSNEKMAPAAAAALFAKEK